MTSPNITSTIQKSTIESSVNQVTIVTEFTAKQGLPGTGLSVWGQNDW